MKGSVLVPAVMTCDHCRQRIVVEQIQDGKCPKCANALNIDSRVFEELQKIREIKAEKSAKKIADKENRKKQFENDNNAEVGSFAVVRKNNHTYEFMLIKQDKMDWLCLPVVDENSEMLRTMKAEKVYGNRYVVFRRYPYRIRIKDMTSIRARLPVQLLNQLLEAYQNHLNDLRLHEMKQSERRIEAALNSLPGTVVLARYGKKREQRGYFVKIDNARNLYVMVVKNCEQDKDCKKFDVCLLSDGSTVVYLSFYDIQPADILSEDKRLSRSDMIKILAGYRDYMIRSKRENQWAAGSKLGVRSMVSGGLASP